MKNGNVNASEFNETNEMDKIDKIDEIVFIKHTSVKLDDNGSPSRRSSSALIPHSYSNV